MRSVVLAVALFSAAAARAQLSVHVTAGQSNETRHGQAAVQAVSFEFRRALSPRTDLAIVLAPMHVHQPKSWFGDAFGDGDESVFALSGAVLMRRHFDVDSPRLRPYVELSSGPMWSTRQVPASTSRFNVVTQPGFGVTLPRARVSYVIGYRFLHISNGGYSPRNPGLNVHGVVVGARW